MTTLVIRIHLEGRDQKTDKLNRTRRPCTATVSDSLCVRLMKVTTFEQVLFSPLCSLWCGTV